MHHTFIGIARPRAVTKLSSKRDPPLQVPHSENTWPLVTDITLSEPSLSWPCGVRDRGKWHTLSPRPAAVEPLSPPFAEILCRRDYLRWIGPIDSAQLPPLNNVLVGGMYQAIYYTLGGYPKWTTSYQGKKKKMCELKKRRVKVAIIIQLSHVQCIVEAS